MILGALQQYFEVFGGASVASGAFLLIREDYQIDNQYYLGIFLNLGGRMVWKNKFLNANLISKLGTFGALDQFMGGKSSLETKDFEYFELVVF